MGNMVKKAFTRKRQVGGLISAEKAVRLGKAHRAVTRLMVIKGLVEDDLAETDRLGIRISTGRDRKNKKASDRGRGIDFRIWFKKGSTCSSVRGGRREF